MRRITLKLESIGNEKQILRFLRACWKEINDAECVWKCKRSFC